MREMEPTTETVDAAEAGLHWRELLDKVSRGEGRVIVEDNGAPVAAIISAADLEQLNRLEAQRQADFAILDEIGEAFKDVPIEEIEREVAKAIAEVRAENRQRERRAAG